MAKRCAVYARYSSDQQSPESIPDQFRKCKEYATKHGWDVLDAHVYSDAAMSGASANRPALRALMAAATSKPRPFDILLLDDQSRLSRQMADSLRLMDRLKFNGVRVVCVSQGIDTDDEQSDTLVVMNGWQASHMLKDLRRKTHRGMEGRALKGMHTGGRTFGYHIEPIADGGARLIVHEHEAALVRRIFELHGAGLSLKAIAGTLNAERIPSPRLRKGKTVASWCPSAIRAILHNEIYTGRLIWNRSQFVKDPDTGRRQRRLRPRSEWIVTEHPELRIVSPELWQRTLDRQQVVKERFCQPGSGQNRTGGHLLSGFLKCECGGNMVLVGRHKYGCNQYWIRRNPACSNKGRIAIADIETRLFAELQKQVLTKQLIDYVLAEVEKQVRDAERGASAEVAGLEKRRSVIEKELRNLAGAVAATAGSPTIMAEIVTREREQQEIASKLASVGQDAFKDRVNELKAFMLSSLSEIRSLMAEDPARAKAKMAMHTGPIRVTPGTTGYTIEGEWNLLGAPVLERTLRG